MPKETSLASLDQFLAQHAHLVAQLHPKAMCERWGLSQEAFAEGLRRSAEKRFGGAQPDAREVEVYLESLHLEDLALACACSEGIEKAWEFFIAQFRQDLRNAARAILGGSGRADDARAEELADSLYAELYGVRSGGAGRRKSLFEYFHGRSKLSTWLRTVLAQKQVDMFRTSGRTVSLEAEMDGEAPREFAGRSESVAAELDPDRERYLARFDHALSAALASLTPRERMILACYYVDQFTLAEIGRLLREHESTVSRQLERMRRALRESVAEALQREIPACEGRLAEPPLDAAQIELAFEYAVGDWPFDLSQALSETEPAGEPPQE
ncbi:MAG TPA: sigma-70 family RNA polymerase sigma factor [Candidatus Acidoferrales bacterium]|jgi:RNA polymerase sigma-70 factor|nr:sigma-70 family RNA polymerase sigma factor [Candidatus Acidoferrales bacterium]